MAKYSSQLLRITHGLIALVGTSSVVNIGIDYYLNHVSQEIQKEMQERGLKMSGVFVCERPSLFRSLWLVNHILPWHAYLELPNGRKVGLGRAENNPRTLEEKRATMWVDHGMQPLHYGLRRVPLEFYAPLYLRYPQLRGIDWHPILPRIEEETQFGKPVLPFLSWQQDHEKQGLMLFTCRTALYLALLKSATTHVRVAVNK